jgi:hypothetical protein
MTYLKKIRTRIAWRGIAAANAFLAETRNSPQEKRAVRDQKSEVSKRLIFFMILGAHSQFVAIN